MPKPPMPWDMGTREEDLWMLPDDVDPVQPPKADVRSGKPLADQLDGEVGATPDVKNGRQWREQIDRTYRDQAARPRNLIRDAKDIKGSVFDTAFDKAVRFGTGDSMGGLGPIGTGGLATIAPKSEAALVRFLQTIAPKAMAKLEASPEAWRFFIGNRRSELEGLPNMYRAKAGGVTTLPGTRTGVPADADRALGIRQDVWNAIKRGGNETADLIPLHELAGHAVQPTGYPARRTVGARLHELLRRSGEKDFAARNIADGVLEAVAAREGLTNAAAREATRRAKVTGRWDQARKEIP